MGARGEGWVIGQVVIGAAILAASVFAPIEVPIFVRAVGVVLLIVGGVVALLGIFTLGSNLTPFPKPKEESHTLTTTGVYALVRHPIYAGIGIGAVGWTLLWGSVLGLALAILLFVWFDLKSRQEEAWLIDKYSEYSAYRTRVKKFIPFLY